MASITQVAAGQAGEGPEKRPHPNVRFERAGEADRGWALGVLLTGEPNERNPAVDQFLEYSRGEGLALDELWLAWDTSAAGSADRGPDTGDRGAAADASTRPRPAAATLIVPCPGRTAIQFLAPASAWASDATAAALFRHAALMQDPRRVRLIQALLEPEQPRARAALLAAGFEELAMLAYMRARANLAPHPLALEDDRLRVLHWAEPHREHFARAILASYEQTLDCPGLLGKREIQDIIAGHMAAGRFRPELWHAIYAGDEPVGVMLLNEVAANDALELVYLGLAPLWRGRGLAQRLVRYALGQAQRHGRSRMILAVDERNEPALGLYRKLGFRITGRKRAMVLSLP